MDISFHISLAVRCHCQPADRPRAFDLDRQHVRGIFHHAAHHRPAGQKPSERRRRHRACPMPLPRFLHKIRGHCRKRADLRICRCCSYNIISHLSQSPVIKLFLLLNLYFPGSLCLPAFSGFLCRSALLWRPFPALPGDHTDPLALFPCRFPCIHIIRSLENKPRTA